MNFITSLEFTEYTDNHDINSTLSNIYIESAQELIENYIGYPLHAQEITEFITGNDSTYLTLSPYQINSVTSLNYLVSGDAIDITNLSISDRKIYFTDGTVFPSDTEENLILKYNAGWHITDEDSNGTSETDIPALFKQTILRIATILSKEADSYIGVKSVSGSNGSTQYMEISFQKYLSVLEKYRAV